MEIIKNKYILFRCIDCGQVELYPYDFADGRRCSAGNGLNIPVTNVYSGYDIGHGKDYTATVNADGIVIVTVNNGG
ncbi:MAG: hypothetical protein ACYCWE_20980 [Eubacteriales bacterium]